MEIYRNKKVAIPFEDHLRPFVDTMYEDINELDLLKYTQVGTWNEAERTFYRQVEDRKRVLQDRIKLKQKLLRSSRGSFVVSQPYTAPTEVEERAEMAIVLQDMADYRKANPSKKSKISMTKAAREEIKDALQYEDKEMLARYGVFKVEQVIKDEAEKAAIAAHAHAMKLDAADYKYRMQKHKLNTLNLNPQMKLQADLEFKKERLLECVKLYEQNPTKATLNAKETALQNAETVQRKLAMYLKSTSEKASYATEMARRELEALMTQEELAAHHQREFDEFQDRDLQAREIRLAALAEAQTINVEVGDIIDEVRVVRPLRKPTEQERSAAALKYLDNAHRRGVPWTLPLVNAAGISPIIVDNWRAKKVYEKIGVLTDTTAITERQTLNNFIRKEILQNDGDSE